MTVDQLNDIAALLFLSDSRSREGTDELARLEAAPHASPSQLWGWGPLVPPPHTRASRD